MTAWTLLLLISFMQIIFQYFLFKSVHTDCNLYTFVTNCNCWLFCLLFCFFFSNFLYFFIEVSSSELFFGQLQIIFIHVLSYTFFESLISILSYLDFLLSAVSDKINKNKLIKVIFLFLFEFLFQLLNFLQ